ncbi:hypothetical protein [Pararhizobium mangrovi]|uniref:Flagellar FliJ protein n=1 Tax=Pararhizobium mangrovi TaxID=2590452 RepID=A0A506TZI0_9HYPH|nr:hypothetical protein [Pararhizobium mangrovi]TPW26910.1 hypothetical protein FJU11_13125 [Pararhizobium mangrovi]
MERPPADKLKRLAAVQRQIETMAELELADANREIARVERQIEDTLEAIGSMRGPHPLFSKDYARRAMALGAQRTRLQGLARVKEKNALAERARGDRLDERHAEARAHETRAGEEEDLYDLLDQRVHRGDASLP